MEQINLQRIQGEQEELIMLLQLKDSFLLKNRQIFSIVIRVKYITNTD